MCGFRFVWVQKVDHHHFTAPTALLVVGIVANAMLLGYTLYTDPGALTYGAALLLIGMVLYLVNRRIGDRAAPPAGAHPAGQRSSRD